MMYNFKGFSIEEVTNECYNIRITIITYPRYNKIGDKYINYIKDYVHQQKEIETLQQIIASEKYEKIRNWIAPEHEIEDAKFLEERVKEILNIIATEKSHKTKNTYLAKKKYYNLNDDDFIKYDKVEQHENIIKDLAMEDKFTNFYKLNISTYCMYSHENILATKDIIEQIQINIGEIMKNTNVLTEHLFKFDEHKKCDVVQEQKNKTDDKNADEICDKIKEIENPTKRDHENTFKEVTLEEMINKFYSKVMLIIDNNYANKTDNKSCTEDMIKEVDQSIYVKYTKLMTKVKELHNISKEATKILNEFNENMEMFKTHTDQIETEFIDNEDIYLGLDTLNYNGKTATDNIQNERKLCELRIIKIMENVITYKSMIVQTEVSMLELVDEIEKFENRSTQRNDDLSAKKAKYK